MKEVSEKERMEARKQARRALEKAETLDINSCSGRHLAEKWSSDEESLGKYLLGKRCVHRGDV